MKIGLLGGSFDPVHNGHLAMARAALTQEGLDRVFFLPAGDPPHKPDLHFPAAVRMRMLAEAVKEEERFGICTIDLTREGASYTALTLKDLKKADPADTFYFIVGADSLDYMQKWYHPEEIFSRAVILSAPRKGFAPERVVEDIKALTARFSAEIRELDMPPVDISSTAVRAVIAEGRLPEGLVPDGALVVLKELLAAFPKEDNVK